MIVVFQFLSMNSDRHRGAAAGSSRHRRPSVETTR